MTTDNYMQKIDLIDMFWEWLSLWRSLLVIVIISIIIGGFVSGFGGEVIPPITNNNAEEMTETEPVLLSESEKKTVDNLAENYKRFVVLKSEYDNINCTLSTEEKIAVLENIIASEYYIEYQKNLLTEIQKAYYYSLIGVNTSVKEIDNSSINGMLCVFTAIFIHLMICCFVYIFNRKLKMTDEVSELMDCAKLTKCIDWRDIDRRKGFDKIVAKCRLSREKRVEFSDAEQIDADMIREMALNSNIKKIAIIGGGLYTEADRFKELIDKENTGITVNVVDSLFYDARGSKEMADSDGAVILAKVKQTNVKYLCEEGMALKNRGVKLLGVAMYV